MIVGGEGYRQHWLAIGIRAQQEGIRQVIKVILAHVVLIVVIPELLVLQWREDQLQARRWRHNALINIRIIVFGKVEYFWVGDGVGEAVLGFDCYHQRGLRIVIRQGLQQGIALLQLVQIQLCLIAIFLWCQQYLVKNHLFDAAKAGVAQHHIGNLRDRVIQGKVQLHAPAGAVGAGGNLVAGFP
ncbi:hypothetical protein D3C81_746830 [compost metagenome]